MPAARPQSNRWEDAQNHLLQAHPLWQGRIGRVGLCLLRPRRDRFGTLVRAIIGQQISSKAAASIDARLRSLGRARSTTRPACWKPAWRPCAPAGLSGVKAFLRAQPLRGRRLGPPAPGPARPPAGRGDHRSADPSRSKGVGRWTAEMFLIFALCRPDVLPVADLGIRVGLRVLISGSTPCRTPACASS